MRGKSFTGSDAAPTVSISSNPASISAGSSSTLTVTATNATQLTVSGTDGSSYTLTGSGGTQTVSPSATTTYTATAQGIGGTVSAKAIVTVTASPAPTVTITANPASIVAGTSSTLKCSRDECDPGYSYRQRWLLLYPRSHGRSTGRHSNRDHHLYGDCDWGGRQRYSYCNRDGKRKSGADCEHHSKSSLNFFGELIHFDCSGSLCHTGNSRRIQ